MSLVTALVFLGSFLGSMLGQILTANTVKHVVRSEIRPLARVVLSLREREIDESTDVKHLREVANHV